MTVDAILVNGPCVVCDQGTDTALAFEGVAEWLTAGLMVLGVPRQDAIAMVEDTWPQGVAFDVVVTQPVRVCAACVARCAAEFPAPGDIVLGNVPIIVATGGAPDD